MIEKRSIQHRSSQTTLGPSPQILLKQGSIDAQEFDFLLHFPVEASTVSPVSFLSPHAWGAIKVQYTAGSLPLHVKGSHFHFVNHHVITLYPSTLLQVIWQSLSF